MDIQDLARRLRRVKNVTHFAIAAGLSRRTVQRFAILQNNPNLETLMKIEKQLDKEVPTKKPAKRLKTAKKRV